MRVRSRMRCRSGVAEPLHSTNPFFFAIRSRKPPNKTLLVFTDNKRFAVEAADGWAPPPEVPLPGGERGADPAKKPLALVVDDQQVQRLILREALENGILAGYQMVDVKAQLVFGSYHDVDSSEMAFKIAGSMAIKEAVQKGDPVILEPIMRVEVTTPEEYMGDVIGDLNARRGQILGMEPRGNAQVIRAFVPLAEMFGYATDLRSKTQGRGSFVMFFDHYQEVPKQVQEKLIKGQ